MNPFTVYNYSCSFGPGMALPAAAAQLKTRRAHSEPTQSKHTRRHTNTMPRPRDTPFEAVFLTLRATHKLLSKFQLFFISLFSSFFSVSFFGISFVDIWHKDYVILPRTAERGRATFVSGFRLRLHSHVGFGLFGSVKNRCALSNEINDEYVGTYFEKPKISSQYMFTRAFVCRLS